MARKTAKFQPFFPPNNETDTRQEEEKKETRTNEVKNEMRHTQEEDKKEKNQVKKTK